MNEKLMNYYLLMPRPSNNVLEEIKSYKCDIPYKVLNKVLPGSWSYEILSEGFYEGIYYVTINLYLPGMVIVGASNINIDITKNFHEHGVEMALNHACRLLGAEISSPKQDIPSNTNEFTKEQKEALTRFTKEYEILNDEMFLRYLKVWNKNIKSKSELTPSNVDSFLNMIKNIEKLE